MGKMSIREFFSAPTRYLAQAVGRESEFEKPYLDDDRGKMHSDPPWPDWPPFTPPPPWPPLPPVPGPGPMPGCAIVCYPPLSDCDEPVWCHPSIWCGQDGDCTLCTWVVEGATSGYSPHGTGGAWGIDVWLDSDLAEEDGKALATICMTDPCGNVCCEDVEVSCKVCPPETVISWDDTLSAETIGQGNGGYATAGVYVKDGLGPYSWSVTGTGFSMLHNKTEGVSNTLQADASACGSATITVTDHCEDTVVGYVRCTVGQWSEIPFTSCVISGAITEEDGQTRIQDKWKLVEVWGITCSTSGSCSGLCATYYDYCHCLEPADCHTTMGCTQCLNHGGICNQAGYSVECFSPADCYCCALDGNACSDTGGGIVMCSRSSSKLYEWVC